MARDNMRYFEAKVLVPMRSSWSAQGQWEGLLLRLYGGFHQGPSVQGQTCRWGKERMLPYHVAFDLSDTADVSLKLGPIARAVKDIFGEEAVYIAVTELAAPFIC